MNKGDIYEICTQYMNKMENIDHEINFEAKGVMNSEMLLACSMASNLGVKLIIECGRARGQSTTVLCKFFPPSSGVQIKSIEWNRYTEDSIIAMQRLKSISNLELLFGNAFELLPQLAKDEECVVIIDGPKGNDAVLLASKIFRNPNVRAVFIHDLHDDANGRESLTTLYPSAFYTDDSVFVDKFKALDDKCWEQQRQHKGFEEGWEPYMRHGRTIKSYSSTFGMVLNEQEGIDKFADAQRIIENINAQTPKPAFLFLKKLIFSIINNLGLPLWFLRYHLVNKK